MVTINRYIKALLHPAGGHQGSHKAHQAGYQYVSILSAEKQDSYDLWHFSAQNIPYAASSIFTGGRPSSWHW